MTPEDVHSAGGNDDKVGPHNVGDLRKSLESVDITGIPKSSFPPAAHDHAHGDDGSSVAPGDEPSLLPQLQVLGRLHSLLCQLSERRKNGGPS